MKIITQRQAHVEFEIHCFNCKSELLAHKNDIVIDKHWGSIQCPRCQSKMFIPSSVRLGAQKGYPMSIIQWVNEEIEKLNQ